jgi:hypothetical protein
LAQLQRKVSSRYNASLSDIIKMYADMGYTLREASEELNLKYSTLKTWAWTMDVKFVEHREPSDYLPRAIEYEGEEYTVTDLAKKFGLPRSVVSDRLRNGWPVEKAVTRGVAYTRRCVPHSAGSDKSTDGMDIGRLWLRGKL